MKTIELSISDEHAALIERWLAEGKWNTASDILMTALDEIQNICERDPEMSRIADAMEKDRRYKELKAAIAKGIESADRGELIDGDEFFDELLADLDDDADAPDAQRLLQAAS
jgi:Arc/MetJ-type ribon-helix-helix transcriptional regulator